MTYKQNAQDQLQLSICIQQPSFKAWEADSILQDNINNNLNLLNNFKSQLAKYQKKYHRQQSKKNIKLKLPSLSKIKKDGQSVTKSCFQGRGQTLTCRQNNQERTQRQSQQSYIQKDCKKFSHKNKSIQLKQYSSKALKNLQCNILINKQNQTKQKLVSINPLIKIHQMKFEHNSKRLKKRDIYLAIFGQKNRNKVQKLISDQNEKQNQYKKSVPLKNKTKTQKTIEF